MKVFQREQIWLVNFDPSFGHEYRKVRPALVVENDKYILSGQLITVIPISSQITKQTSLDFLLKKDSNNRLIKDSLVKTKQVSSFDKRRFVKYIGDVKSEMMEEIDQNLRLYLNL
jgi:mRNA interferase MazF